MAVSAQKTLALTALVFLALMPKARANCEPFQDVPVNVTRIFDDPAYIDTQNLAFIQTLSRDPHRSIHESITLGVTRYAPVLEFLLAVETEHLGDGTSCARVAKADVTVGYRDVNVYIASEIPEDTCGYNEVKKHEQKHIQANEALLDDFIPKVKGELAAYLKQNGLSREPSPDYALQLLQNSVHAMLKNLGEQMVTENRNRQQRIDSPAEYERITRSCNGELARIAVASQEPRR